MLIRLRMRRLICAFVVCIGQNRFSHDKAQITHWFADHSKTPRVGHERLVLNNQKLGLEVNFDHLQHNPAQLQLQIITVCWSWCFGINEPSHEIMALFVLRKLIL